MLLPGKNCQVSQSVYDEKFSSHVVVSVPGATWALTHDAAVTLNAIMMCIPSSDSDRPLLVYTDPKDGVTQSLIDQRVYTNGRCFRLLYNCKLKSPSPLLPILGSSKKVVDHLVNAYPELTAPPGIDDGSALGALDPDAIARRTASLAASMDAAGAAALDVGQLLRRPRPLAEGGRGGASQPGRPVVPDWQTRELDHVRTMLLGNAGLAAELRIPAVAFSGEYVLSRNLMRFQIDQAVNPRCPYGERVHSNNHCFMQYDHALQMCTLGCYNETCKGKVARGDVDEVTVHCPVSSRLAAVTAAVDVTQQRDLHTRQHLVRWSEEYTARKMNPYPLDERLIVIRANMGAGECYSALFTNKKKYRILIPCESFMVGKTKALVVHLHRKEQQACQPPAPQGTKKTSTSGSSPSFFGDL